MTDAVTTSRNLTRTLATAAGVSLVGGGALATLTRAPRWRAFGQQTAAWGAVDLAIAGLAGRRPATDAGRLRRVLLFNAGLDLAYIATGAHVAFHRPTFGGRVTSEQAHGHGLAVVAQGALLLALDLGFARRLAEA